MSYYDPRRMSQQQRLQYAQQVEEDRIAQQTLQEEQDAYEAERARIEAENARIDLLNTQEKSEYDATMRQSTDTNFTPQEKAKAIADLESARAMSQAQGNEYQVQVFNNAIQSIRNLPEGSMVTGYATEGSVAGGLVTRYLDSGQAKEYNVQKDWWTEKGYPQFSEYGIPDLPEGATITNVTEESYVTGRAGALRNEKKLNITYSTPKEMGLLESIEKGLMNLYPFGGKDIFPRFVSASTGIPESTTRAVMVTQMQENIKALDAFNTQLGATFLPLTGTKPGDPEWREKARQTGYTAQTFGIAAGVVATELAFAQPHMVIPTLKALGIVGGANFALTEAGSYITTGKPASMQELADSTLLSVGFVGVGNVVNPLLQASKYGKPLMSFLTSTAPKAITARASTAFGLGTGLTYIQTGDVTKSLGVGALYAGTSLAFDSFVKLNMRYIKPRVVDSLSQSYKVNFKVNERILTGKADVAGIPIKHWTPTSLQKFEMLITGAKPKVPAQNIVAWDKPQGLSGLKDLQAELSAGDAFDLAFTPKSSLQTLGNSIDEQILKTPKSLPKYLGLGDSLFEINYKEEKIYTQKTDKDWLNEEGIKPIEEPKGYPENILSVDYRGPLSFDKLPIKKGLVYGKGKAIDMAWEEPFFNQPPELKVPMKTLLTEPKKVVFESVKIEQPSQEVIQAMAGKPIRANFSKSVGSRVNEELEMEFLVPPSQTMNLQIQKTKHLFLNQESKLEITPKFKTAIVENKDILIQLNRILPQQISKPKIEQTNIITPALSNLISQDTKQTLFITQQPKQKTEQITSLFSTQLFTTQQKTTTLPPPFFSGGIPFGSPNKSKRKLDSRYYERFNPNATIKQNLRFALGSKSKTRVTKINRISNQLLGKKRR